MSWAAKSGGTSPFDVVFRGGSGSTLEEIRETFDYGEPVGAHAGPAVTAASRTSRASSSSRGAIVSGGRSRRTLP